MTRPLKLRDDFLGEIEDFLAATGQAPTSFGRAVLGDPGFVAALRKGRCPTARTIEFVRAHIVRKGKEAMP